MSSEARRVYTLAYRHGGEIVPLGNESPDLAHVQKKLTRKGTKAAELRADGYETLIAFRDLPEWREL